MLEVKKDDSANPLAKPVAEDITNSTIRSATRDRMQARASRRCQPFGCESAGRIASFKVWLKHEAQKAAEGGFLGFGCVAVSDAERATLGEITETLGLPIQTSDARPL